jgi:RNA polymerase sigma-70 factor, ECF subfamily
VVTAILLQETTLSFALCPLCHGKQSASVLSKGDYENSVVIEPLGELLKRLFRVGIQRDVPLESNIGPLADEFMSDAGAVNPLPNGSKTLQDGAFEQHRPLLFAIAYRMLGSVADTEDLLQDTFIRWQQVPAVEVKSPRAFLVTILTRLCINYLQAARLKYEAYVGQWLPEPIATSPVVDPLMSLGVNESLSFGFLLLLQRLTPVERAVLVLREVFDYEYSEIASILNRTEPNCRQVLRRARQHIKEDRMRFEASREQQEELLRRWSEASSEGNLGGLIALLSEDAVFYSDGGGKAPALPNPIHGPANIARGVLEGMKRFGVPKTLVRREIEINGRPGIISFLDGRPFSTFTIEVLAGNISRVYVVTNPDKLKNLPALHVLRA